MATIMKSAAFRRAVKAGEATPADAVLRKDYAASVVAVADDRKVKFTISTATPDREGDSVSVEGWDLAAYMRNPVVLWGHDGHSLPIGRCVEIGVEGEALVATVEFLPADVPERGAFAEAVLRMLRDGFLSAVSVGFRPLEYDVATSRQGEDDWWAPLNFIRQELLEFSVVSIPCNPEALIDPAERRVPQATPAVPAAVAEPVPAPEADADKEAGGAAKQAEAAAQKRARDRLERRARLLALS